jgi:hypothetical protein
MGAAETFLATFALTGLALGAAGGAASALAGLSPAKCFAAALALHVAALAVPDLSQVLATGDLVAAIVVGPLLVFVPPAAGFVGGRSLVELLRGKPPSHGSHG